jgi:hypothetical protein
LIADRSRLGLVRLVVIVLLAAEGCGLIVGFESEYTPLGAAGGGSTSTSSVASSSTTSTSTGTGSACAHDFCARGEQLDPACDPCVSDVCKAYPSCCQKSGTWDDECIHQVNVHCNNACCGDGVCVGEVCDSCPKDCGHCPCPHSVCADAGAPIGDSCQDPCVADVCKKLPSCCSDQWTAACSALGTQLCSGVEPCVTKICQANNNCCTSAWTQNCVDLATANCGVSCKCAHAMCTIGDALLPQCDPCVESICAADKHCCKDTWDLRCLTEVESICGIRCL